MPASTTTAINAVGRSMPGRYVTPVETRTVTLVALRWMICSDSGANRTA
jgi:hypothetical protein